MSVSLVFVYVPLKDITYSAFIVIRPPRKSAFLLNKPTGWASPTPTYSSIEANGSLFIPNGWTVPTLEDSLLLERPFNYFRKRKRWNGEHPLRYSKSTIAVFLENRSWRWSCNYGWKHDQKKMEVKSRKWLWSWKALYVLHLLFIITLVNHYLGLHTYIYLILLKKV